MDADSGMVHTVETTSANVHDSNKVVDLLQGTEEEVYGDSGYLGAEKKEDAILVNVRTPLSKITSTGEIEQRFRLN